MRYKKLLSAVLASTMIFNLSGIAAAETIEENDVIVIDEAMTDSESPIQQAVEEIPGTLSNLQAFDKSFYNVTGFASVNNSIKDRSEYVGTAAHKKVSNAKEFLAAIAEAKDGKVKIIELTDDIDLGWNKLALTSSEKSQYSFVAQYGNPKPNDSLSTLTELNGFTNPDMKESGVTKLSLSGIDGLTIFSANGSAIKHVETKLNKGANDIVIRNIHFKNMWQWDDDLKQKAVGWSNLKLNGGTNLWIDHCTFDVAFDGNIDLENGSTGISITWCKIGQDAKEDFVSGNAIYDSIMFMESLYQEGKLTTGSYYKDFRDGYTNRITGEVVTASPEDIMAFSAYHDKCHLVGSGDKDYVDYVDGNGVVTPDANSNIKLTLAYNHYLNIGQRLPMIRQGTGHLINCYIDDSAHMDLSKGSKFVDAPSNYKFSRCINARNGASIAADTCVFNGVEDPIIGAESQGLDLGNMSGDWKIYFKNAYNRSLIVNSEVTNSVGTYVGSSWDNEGVNSFITKNYKWSDKSTINNWAWSSSIVGKEGYDKSNPPKGTDGKAFPFEFTYNTDEKLPYEYNVMPLDEVKTIVPANAGCITGAAAEINWCSTTASAAPSASEKANAAAAAISAIGTVEYTDACKDKIDEAEAAYEALRGHQKELITNYDVLTAAKEAYAKLKEEGDKPSPTPSPAAGNIYLEAHEKGQAAVSENAIAKPAGKGCVIEYLDNTISNNAITVIKGNKLTIADGVIKTFISDDKKTVAVNKKGVIAAKKATNGIKITYEAAAGGQKTLLVRVIEPVVGCASISGNAAVKSPTKPNVRLSAGAVFDLTYSLPLNAQCDTAKLKNKGCTILNVPAIGEDGLWHITGTAGSKGNATIPFIVNGKKVNFKITIKK